VLGKRVTTFVASSRKKTFAPFSEAMHSYTN
jgi:hypothetical protein